jgi:hypothetical protein
MSALVMATDSKAKGMMAIEAARVGGGLKWCNS